MTEWWSVNSFSNLWPLGIGTLFGIVYFIFSRTKLKSNSKIELTPNCLLTRQPVMLISEPDHRLKFEKHDHAINKRHRFESTYQMLKEHGYKVEWTKIPLDFQSQVQVQKQLKDLLEELLNEKQRYHFFICPEAFENFNEVLSHEKSLAQIVESVSSLRFKDPRLALHRAVELAEQDFIGADPK